MSNQQKTTPAQTSASPVSIASNGEIKLAGEPGFAEGTPPENATPANQDGDTGQTAEGVQGQNAPDSAAGDSAPAAKQEGTQDTTTPPTVSDVPAAPKQEAAPAAVKSTPAQTEPKTAATIPAKPQVPVQQPKVEASIPGLQRAPMSFTGVAEIDAELESKPTTLHALFSQLGEYAKVMAPNRPILATDGARQQVVLYRVITGVVNRTGEDFRTAFSMLLKFAQAYKDQCFSELYVFRFMDIIPLPENDRAAFRALVNLLKVTADPKSRQIALKQVDLTKSLENGVTEQGRQRVQSFFGNN